MTSNPTNAGEPGDSPVDATPSSPASQPISSPTPAAGPSVEPAATAFGPRPLWDPGAIPAATVIPLRSDTTGGLQVLMLRRDTRLRFAGGMWVFPGGRIDDEDFGDRALRGSPDHDEMEAAALVAVQRELAEEAGITIEASTIRRWSQWTPPPTSEQNADLLRHRFTTAFYVAVAVGDTDAVTIDDGEIRDHRWTSPPEMLDAHCSGEITLAPPTFITLVHLAGLSSPAEVLMGAPGGRNGPPEVEHFATHVGSTADGWAALYHGDVAYDGGDMEAVGGRHRLWMDDLPWRYERSLSGEGVGHP